MPRPQNQTLRGKMVARVYGDAIELDVASTDVFFIARQN
jgi:hypothetical protein